MLVIFTAVDVCVVSDCEIPLNITNGKVNYTDTICNATVTYRCEKGYRLIGDNAITCDVNGAWFGNIPVCEIVGM